MKMRTVARRPAILLSLMTLVLMSLLGACGGEDPTPTSPPSQPAAATPTSAPAPAAEPTPTLAPGQPTPTPSPPTPTPSTTTGPAPAPAPTPTVPPPDPSFDAEGYFSGRTIKFTVGFSPGGGFDAFTRILAVHLPRFIPGSPKIVVSNLPGAASLLTARATAGRAPGDGFDIGVFTQGLLIQSLLGVEFEGFEPTEFVFVGLPDNTPSRGAICVRADSADSLDSFVNSPRPFRLGESQPGSSPAPHEEWLVMAGLPIEIIYGYQGTADVRVAFERGEIEVTSRCDDSALPAYPHWADPAVVTPLFHHTQLPPDWVVEGQANGLYPWFKPLREVVSVSDILMTALELETSLAGSRVFALPPGTPPEVAHVIREAFATAVESGDFKADMRTRGYTTGLLRGTELQERVQRFADQPAEVLTVLRDMYKIE